MMKMGDLCYGKYEMERINTGLPTSDLMAPIYA